LTELPSKNLLFGLDENHLLVNKKYSDWNFYIVDAILISAIYGLENSIYNSKIYVNGFVVIYNTFATNF